MRSFPKKDFSKFFVGANPNAVDVLDRLLVMDPDRRASAAELLGHPYFANYADPEDEVGGVLCLGDMTPLFSHMTFVDKAVFFLQPNSGPYDDSFEKLTLDADGWRSECLVRTMLWLHWQ